MHGMDPTRDDVCEPKREDELAATVDEVRVAVLGPGAIGGLLAAVLVRERVPVVVVGGQPTVGEIRSSGLKVESQRFGSFAVVVPAEEALAGNVDVGVLSVKARDLKAAAERVEGCLDAGIPFVTLLNGFEHVELLRTWYPGASVVGASIRAEVSRRDRVTIAHTSPFAEIRLAGGFTPSSPVGRLMGALLRGGFDVQFGDSEEAVLWGKLAFLAPLALLTTLRDENLGAVRAEHGEELEAITREVCMVARGSGAVVDPDEVLGMLHSAPASMESSMQRDARLGRPTEVDAIGGAVLRAARREDLDVPALQHVVEVLMAREPGVA